MIDEEISDGVNRRMQNQSSSVKQKHYILFRCNNNVAQHPSIHSFQIYMPRETRDGALRVSSSKHTHLISLPVSTVEWSMPSEMTPEHISSILHSRFLLFPVSRLPFLNARRLLTPRALPTR